MLIRSFLGTNSVDSISTGNAPPLSSGKWFDQVGFLFTSWMVFPMVLDKQPIFLR